MSDIQDRIKSVKEEIESLKQQISEQRSQKADSELWESAGDAGVVTKCPLKSKKVLKGHFGKIYAMHWSTDNKHLVSASQDGKLIIWNAHTTNKVQAIPLRSSWVMTCAFGTDGSVVACGGLDNICSIYSVKNKDDVTSMKPIKELSAHDGYLSCCRFMDGGSKIITSSGDSTCILWDVEASKPIKVFTDHGGDVMSVSISPTSNNTFVSGACDSTAKVWDIDNGRCVQTFAGHESDINSVQFFPDGQAFGTGSDDASCRMFDLRAYREMSKYENDSIVVGITSVSFSRTGKFLCAGYDDYNCYIWDTVASASKPDSASSQFSFLVAGHENRVSCLGVSPGGQALCTGSWDTLLKVWA